MTKTMATAGAVGVGVAALVGLMFGDNVTPVTKVSEWARLAVTAMALLLGGYIIWQNRSTEAKDEAITAYKTAVEAHKLECEGLQKRLTTITEEKTVLQAEVLTLKSKTDMGEVLRLLTVMTSNTFTTLERHEELILSQGDLLKDIQKKVNGWHTERRKALRASDT